MSPNSLIQKHIQRGILKTPRIIKAFRKIKREDFMRPEDRGLAEIDEAFPIGYGQTISQPLTVAFMTELLDPRPGQKILDVGSGSGWQAAILGEIVGKRGTVYGIELIPELANFARENIKNTVVNNVKIICGDGSQGLPDKAPFDRIMAAAAAKKIPEALKKQLKISGKMVIPVEVNGHGDQSIFLIKRIGRNKWSEKEFPGFVFVPLISA